MLGISDDVAGGPGGKGGKKGTQKKNNNNVPLIYESGVLGFFSGKRRIRITFNEEEEIINPEDIDPTVGRFRNMIETTVIPKKVPDTQDFGRGLVFFFFKHAKI